MSVSVSAADAVMLAVVWMPPLLESVKLIVDPVEAPFAVSAEESVIVTVSLVLNVRLGVATVDVMVPVAPAASRVTEVVPVMVPDPESAPPPVAETCVVVPEIAALTTTAPAPVIDRLPPEVILLVSVMPALSVTVRPPVPAVETPLPVMACESDKVIEPPEPEL